MLVFTEEETFSNKTDSGTFAESKHLEKVPSSVNTRIMILLYSQKKRPFQTKKIRRFIGIGTYRKGAFFCKFMNSDTAVFTEGETFSCKKDCEILLNLERRKGTPHDVAVFTEGETFSSKKDFGICMKTDQSDMTYYSVPVCYHDSFLRRRRHQSILFCHCENPDFVLHQIHHIMPRCSSSRRVPSAAHTKLAHYVA